MIKVEVVDFQLASTLDINYFSFLSGVRALYRSCEHFLIVEGGDMIILAYNLDIRTICMIG